MVRDFDTLQLVLVIIFDMFLGEVASIFTYRTVLRIFVLNNRRIAVNIIVWSNMFVIEPVLSLMLQIADVRILLWRVIAMSIEDAKNLPLSMKKKYYNSWSFQKAVALHITSRLFICNYIDSSVNTCVYDK